MTRSTFILGRAACVALATACVATIPHARAQVSSNLDALGPAPAPAHTTPHGHRPAPSHAAARAPAANAQGGLHNPPSVPDHPPPPVVIPPPAVSVPLHPPPPPPPVTAVADARGATETTDGALRITFSGESADFNQGMIDAVHRLAQHLRDNPLQRVSILAFSHGSADDLSTPRRISLTRALNARAILINDGIAPTRIYPRPIGLAPKTGTDANAPEDRIDLVLAGLEGPPPPNSPAHPPPH